MPKGQRCVKRVTRDVPDRLTDLPADLKVLIVEAATCNPLFKGMFPEFVVCERGRLAVVQAIRLINTSFARLRKTTKVLYDVTSSFWAAQSAMKAAWKPATDILAVFRRQPQGIEIALYTKEREAFFAVLTVAKGDLTMLKEFLSFQKRRKDLVDTHLQESGVYDPNSA